MFRITRKTETKSIEASGMSKYALRQGSLTLAIGTSLSVGSATAATITVTSAADGPIGSVAGCSLREAIASANNGSSQGGCSAGSVAADTIVFDMALAQSTITLSEGALEITRSLTITGPLTNDPSGLIIDGDNLARVFDIEGESDSSRITTTLEGMTLTRGRATGLVELGGAIRGRYVDLTVQQTLITGNSVSVSSSADNTPTGAYGGGVSVVRGNATIVDSRITDNIVTSSSSGNDSQTAAGASGLLVLYGNVSLVNTAVEDNQAYANASGNARSNVVAGVALANIYDSPVVVTIVDSSISRNTAQSTGGDLSEPGRAFGGGLLVNGSGGSALIVGSTIADNTLIADESVGGGIINRSSQMSLINSTVSGNSITGAAGQGSGIAFTGPVDQPGGLQLEHSTVAFNTASNGSEAIHLIQDPSGNSSLTLDASIIVQGSPGEAACNIAADSASNSLVTDASCTGTATALDAINLTGLSDNGGSTPTHGLLPDSVAIDAINPCLPEPMMDQRGRPRPGTGSSGCDIGALEVQQDDDFDLLFGDRFEP